MMSEMMRLGTPSRGTSTWSPWLARGTWSPRMWMGPGRAEQSPKATHPRAPGSSADASCARSDQGEMEGMPFNGLGYTGFDNYKQQFVGTWMDSWSTGYMARERPSVQGRARAITTSGQWEGPMGDHDLPLRHRDQEPGRARDDHVHDAAARAKR